MERCSTIEEWNGVPAGTPATQRSAARKERRHDHPSHDHRSGARRPHPGPGAARPRDPGVGLRGRPVARRPGPGRHARHPPAQRAARPACGGPVRGVPRPRPPGRPADAGSRQDRGGTAGGARRRDRRPPGGAPRRAAPHPARVTAAGDGALGEEGHRGPPAGRRAVPGDVRRRDRGDGRPAGRRGRRLVAGAAAALGGRAGVRRHVVHRDLPVRGGRPPPGQRTGGRRRWHGRARTGPGHPGPPGAGRRAAHLRGTAQAGRMAGGHRLHRPGGRGPDRGGVRRLGAGADGADRRRRDPAGAAGAAHPAGRAPLGPRARGDAAGRRRPPDAPVRGGRQPRPVRRGRARPCPRRPPGRHRGRAGGVRGGHVRPQRGRGGGRDRAARDPLRRRRPAQLRQLPGRGRRQPG